MSPFIEWSTAFVYGQAVEGYDMRLEDTSVIVTGGGSGIGAAIAEKCATEGALVIVSDIDTDAGRETVRTVESAGGRATFRKLDVRDSDAFEDLVKKVAREHGLDVVVNNAGVGQSPTPVENTGFEAFERILDVNVRGVWNGCTSAIPVLKEQESGSIINIASLAGMIGSPGQAAYSLSKGAVLNFTRAIAAEVGSHGIRANAVCPGVVDTQLVRNDFGGDRDWEVVRNRMADNYPLGRLGRPADVANCVAFLASDEAAFVTGHGLVVDGGYSCS